MWIPDECYETSDQMYKTAHSSSLDVALFPAVLHTVGEENLRLVFALEAVAEGRTLLP